MFAVYIKLHSHLNTNLSLPSGLFAQGYKIECLKNAAPDDGEADHQRGKYRIYCQDAKWKELIDCLNNQGKSLVYSVVETGDDGINDVIESGELNSDVAHYSTRLINRRQLFTFWFDDCLQTAQATACSNIRL